MKENTVTISLEKYEEMQKSCLILDEIKGSANLYIKTCSGRVIESYITEDKILTKLCEEIGEIRKEIKNLKQTQSALEDEYREKSRKMNKEGNLLRREIKNMSWWEFNKWRSKLNDDRWDSFPYF